MSAGTKTAGRSATTAVVPGRGILSIGDPRTATRSGYVWTALSDVARLESGHTPSRSREDYWNGGIPWIGVKDATAHNGEVIARTAQHVSLAGVENSSTRLLPAGTVCLSRTASVGYVVQMGVAMCTSQDFVNWVCDDDLNPSYLRYALVTESESIRSWATGSTHQTLYYPEAKALHILLPRRRVQDAVVDVLKAFDDKISTNRRVVAKAGAVGESLVRAADAALRPLGDVANIVMGTSPKGEELNEQGSGVDFHQGVRDFGSLIPKPRIATEHPVRTVGPWSTLLAVRAPVGRTNLAIGTTAIGRGLAGLTSETSPATLYFTLRAAEHVWDEHQGGGTVFASVNAAEVRTTRVPMPRNRELEVRLSALLERAVVAEQESDRLAATRDELLPLLMDGRITVRDAEKRVEEEV